MKSKNLIGVALSAAFVAAAAGQAPFTPGNLVVLQINDGVTTIPAGAAAPLFLVEINIGSGAIVQTIPVPTTTVGANRRLTTRGSSTSVGHLTRSVDKAYLMFIGLDAAPLDTAPGGGQIQTVTSDIVNRVVGRAGANGVIDTSTALIDAYSGNDPRGVASTNGIDFWISGAGGLAGSGGPRYTTFGSTTSVQISSAPTNIRVIRIFNGQLYETSASGIFQGVCTVGTGLPTTPGESTTLLNGFPTATGPSSYDFFFSDSNTVYVADDRTVTPTNNGGGVEKWVFDSGAGTWSKAYTLQTGLNNGCRGLTGKVTRNGVQLWATTAEAIANLVTVVDTGAASSFSVLATSPAAAGGTQPIFRGIDFAPEGGSTGPVCYPNCDGSTLTPCLNVGDFSCFLNSFASGNSYANCDGSTTTPVLNVGDFSCFLNAFASGCSSCV